MFLSFSRRSILAACITLLPVVGVASEITVTDPYARVSRPGAPTGAAFMTITNTSDRADRLISASSDAAKRVELHTHIEVGDGVMKMTELEDGIELPAGGSHGLIRGGDHVMLMGIKNPLEQGDEISVTLTFERAGEIQISIPVDNERQPDHGAMGHGHKEHNHSN